MPKKAESVPENLKYLLPDTVSDTVIVGDTPYVLVPLTAGQAEAVSKEVSEILHAVTKDIIQVVQDAKREDKKLEDMTGMMESLKKGINTVIESGKIISIVAIALDLEEDFIRKNVTVKQLHHFAGAFWKQNFDFSDVPEHVAKNFNGLLEVAGFTNQNTQVFRWAEATLVLLQDSDSGSPERRIDIVLQIAYDLGLLEVLPPRLSKGTLLPVNESTPTLPTTADSTENTSTDAEK